MVLEVAILYVKEGEATYFERDFVTAGQYISSVDGYLRHQLKKCIEVDNKYLLLVEWEDLYAHNVGFRESEVYKKWKNLLHHYYEPFPVVEHYE